VTDTLETLESDLAPLLAACCPDLATAPRTLQAPLERFVTRQSRKDGSLFVQNRHKELTRTRNEWRTGELDRSASGTQDSMSIHGGVGSAAGDHRSLHVNSSATCPACGALVTVNARERADAAVGRHLDKGCQQQGHEGIGDGKQGRGDGGKSGQAVEGCGKIDVVVLSSDDESVQDTCEPPRKQPLEKPFRAFGSRSHKDGIAQLDGAEGDEMQGEGHENHGSWTNRATAGDCDPGEFEEGSDSEGEWESEGESEGCTEEGSVVDSMGGCSSLEELGDESSAALQERRYDAEFHEWCEGVGGENEDGGAVGGEDWTKRGGVEASCEDWGESRELLEQLGDISDTEIERNSCRIPTSSAVQESSGGGVSIVYAPTQVLTEDIAARLQAQGLRAEAYHAGLNRGRLQRVQVAFRRGELSVVVATVAFGMGINKADVRNVVHYGWPQSLEQMFQEAGRAGR
jgi:hypothetical protein